MQKRWKEPRSILMSSADRVAHIDGQLMQLLWAIHTRFQREYKYKSNKTRQSIYECLLGFCLTTFSAPPQILAASTVFFCPIQKRRMMGDGFLWCLSHCCRFVLNLVSVCWASCNKQGQRSSEHFFMVLFPMLFEVRRIVCVRKLNKP